MTNVEKYLTSVGQEVINGAKSILRKKDKGGGNLEKSLDFEVVPIGDNFALRFYMADYGTFVDKGVKGAGGEIKSGIHKGKYGGRRYYTTWEGKRKDSPYKFGSGKSSGSIYKGIGSFIRKKGLQPRSQGGQFMSTTGLKIAIVKVLWTKGIHGISFFQKPFGEAWKTFEVGLAEALKKDIIDNL